MLIRGMEMPTSCASCDIACWHYLYFGADGLLSKICRTESRRPDCPLVPVPPHGRLGDLDELAKKIEHDRYNHTHTDGMAARHHIAEYGNFLKEIAAAPIIIPAEEGES